MTAENLKMKPDALVGLLGKVMDLEAGLPASRGKGGLGRSPRPVMLMLWVAARGPMAQMALGVRLGCSFNAVNNMVRVLVELGWVENRRDMLMRRKTVRLTEAGWERLRGLGVVESGNGEGGTGNGESGLGE